MYWIAHIYSFERSVNLGIGNYFIFSQYPNGRGYGFTLRCLAR